MSTGPYSLQVAHVEDLEPWVGRHRVPVRGRKPDIYLPALHIHTPAVRGAGIYGERLWGMGLTVVANDEVQLAEWWAETGEALRIIHYLKKGDME